MHKAIISAVALMTFLSASGNRAAASASITGALNAIGDQAGTLSLVGTGFLGITSIRYSQTNFGPSITNPMALAFDLGDTRIDIQMPADLRLSSPFPPPFSVRDKFWLLIDSPTQSIMATPSAVITISTPVSSGGGGAYRHVTSTGSYNNIGAGANVTFVDSGGSAISSGGGANYYFVESGASFTFGGGGGNVLISEPGATLIGNPGTFQTFVRDDVTFSNFSVVPEPTAGLLLAGASLMFQFRRHRRSVAGVR